MVLFLPEGLYGVVLRGAALLGQKLRKATAQGAAWTRPAAGASAPSIRPVATTEPLLEIKALSKHFGGIKAVQNLDLTICKGDVAVLIGPNGSGKTTVLNVLSGIYNTSSGSITYRGREISNNPPNAINRLGICRTFQNIRLFPELTALENVAVGYFSKGTVGLVGTLLSRPLGYREEETACTKADIAFPWL